MVLPLPAPSRQLAPLILTPRTTPTAPWARGCSGEKSASGIFLYISKNRVGKTAAKSLKPRLVKSAVFTKSASGVRYYGFRYDNPNTGRWLSRDPLGENGGANLWLFPFCCGCGPRIANAASSPMITTTIMISTRVNPSTRTTREIERRPKRFCGSVATGCSR